MVFEPVIPFRILSWGNDEKCQKLIYKQVHYGKKYLNDQNGQQQEMIK